MSPRVRLVGIGCGDPNQLTLEALEALRAADFVVMTRKGDDDGLADARHAILQHHGLDLPVLEVVDPERDRRAQATRTQDDYESVVRDWHDARARAWLTQFESGRRDHGPVAAVLVWGDPAFYDSTIRVLDRLDIDYDVLPGISAVQLLAARHRIVLHEIGQSVLITTARRLREEIERGADNLIVMLGARLDLQGLEDWQIWWAANLGGPTEELTAGRVGDVVEQIAVQRDRAKQRTGWVMDLYLLRRPA